LDCTQLRSLCVPETIASSLLEKGFTADNGEGIGTKLFDLLENAVVRCRREATAESAVVWLIPYVIVGSRTGRTCFVSKSRRKNSICVETCSLGLTGYCGENETPETAAARILFDSLGVSPDDIACASMMGFLWIRKTPVTAAHIAVVYKVLIDDPCCKPAFNEDLDGHWMEDGDLFDLFHAEMLSAWSRYLLRTQGITGLFTKHNPSPAICLQAGIPNESYEGESV